MKIPAVLFAILFYFSVPCYAGVIFEDNFDTQTDWQPHPASNDASPAGAMAACTSGDCTGEVPTGWSFFRSTGLWWGPTYQDTIRVNGDNHRGASGKAFTMWPESNIGASGDGWGADGILVKYFADEPELYAQFWMKMKPGWRWSDYGIAKIFRIFHYDGSGDIFQFFSGGNGAPIFLFDLKYSSVYGWRYVTTFRCDPQASDYYCPNNPNGSDSDHLFPGNANFTDQGQLGDAAWHRYDFHIKMNTYAGGGAWNSNGIITIWQDGIQLYTRTNNKWINSGTDSTIGWNAIGIGGNQYNTYDNASLHSEQWYAIDDIVISTEYIAADYVVGGPDTTPSAFSFTDVTGAELSTVTPSPDNVTVAGIDAGQTPAITVSGTGCEYSIDGAAFTSDAGTVGLDNVVALRTTSSASHNATITCTVTIGGVSDSWGVRTLAAAADVTLPRMRAGGRGGWR